MMRDLIKKDVLKLVSKSKNKSKIKNENIDFDIEKLLDEAIEETEHFFGKTLKQLPPQGEAHDFLIEMSKTLLEEVENKSNIKTLVNNFCKSDKSVKDFFKELEVSSDISSERPEKVSGIVYNDGVGDQDMQSKPVDEYTKEEEDEKDKLVDKS